MKTISYPDFPGSIKESNDPHAVESNFSSGFFQIHFLVSKMAQTKCICPIIAAIRSRLNRKPFDKQAAVDKCENTSKDITDFCFALMALLFLSPLLTLIALAIKIESKGPVFYTPIRQGRKARLFSCYKFRTMYWEMCDDPNHGKLSTIKGDQRITPLGNFLRKYSLDELPQLINVLRGEMSIVGPRPHRIALRQVFSDVSHEYEMRHHVKPGLTGWAQVNGWRGPTQTLVQRAERIRHDIWYINNQNFWLDMKIMWMTIFRGGFLDPLYH